MIKRVELPPDMDKDRIFEYGKAQVLVIIPKGFKRNKTCGIILIPYSILAQG